MTTTRVLCPLDCGWHHDQAEPDFTKPQPFASHPAPEGVDPLVWGYSLGRTLLVENALKAHLETHTLLEWVTALTTAQRRIAELERSAQELVPQVMALHSLTGKLIDQAQADRLEAAGRCGVCGFDGDRSGCQDCAGGQP